MFKKAKVVMLPSQKANPNLFIHQGLGLKTKTLCTGQGKMHHEEMMKCGVSKPQHLYILSDDKIEEGEFGINLYSTSIFQVVEVKQDGYNVKWITGGNIGNDIQFDSLALPKKIIATTDTSLTTCQCRKVGYHKLSCKQTYNLPQPSQSFIKVFIEEYNKGNVITDVMIEYEEKDINSYSPTWKEDYVKYGIMHEEKIQVFLKINPKDNTITIKKLKDSWSREEVESLINLAWATCSATTYKQGESIQADCKSWIEYNL